MKKSLIASSMTVFSMLSCAGTAFAGIAAPTWESGFALTAVTALWIVSVFVWAENAELAKRAER